MRLDLATAAFQSVPAVFASVNEDEPPRHLGQCTGWDFHGNGVKEYFPQFYRRSPAGLTVLENPPPTAANARTALLSEPVWRRKNMNKKRR